MWEAWTKACNFLRKNFLHRPLGKWLLDPNFPRCQWQAFYDPSQDQLYRYSQDDRDYTIHLRDHNGCSFQSHSRAYNLPNTAFPTDVDSTDNVWLLKRDYSKRSIVPPPPSPTDFSSLLLTLPEWENRLFFGLEFLQSEASLITAIEENDLLIVSDGSAPDKASFG